MGMSRFSVVIVLFIACGGTDAPVTSPDSLLDEDAEQGDISATKVAPAEESKAPEPASLTRTDLDYVLDAGPGAFLARFEVRPHFNGKRFSGWELLGFSEPQSGLASSGLVPGDVVTKVNQQSLERPENLQKLWTALRQAPAIVVSGFRDGEQFELRFDVGDSGPSPAPQSPTP